MNKNLTPPQSAANLRSKVRSKSQVPNPHLRKRMKKTFPHGARPIESQEERRSFFPILSIRRLRLAAAGQILSIGIALILLGLAVPDASADPFTERKSGEDFNTLGVVGNKDPKGLWSDGTTMLVSDVDGRIYSYDLETKQRQDNHHTNADDFFLYKSGTSGPKIRPYGIWSDGTTLWAASVEATTDLKGEITNKTAKLYAWTMEWVTGENIRKDLDGVERYLDGRREPTKDIELHKTMEPTSDPELDGNGNPIVFEVHTNNGEETEYSLSYGSETVTEGEETRTEYYLNNKDGVRLTPNSEGKLTTPNGVVYESANITFQTNMVERPVGNISPTGIWSDGTTMWVADQGDAIKYTSRSGVKENITSEDKIYAYNLWTTNEMDERVFDGSLSTNKVIQLSVASGRQAPYDYTLDKNAYAQGLWSDGETMWVANIRGAADSDEKRIYAYNMWMNSPTGGRMFDGSRESAKDYKNLNKKGNLNDNDRPRGIWSDGKTMWVADQTDNKLYAYHAFLSPTTRNENQDFNDLAANSPVGIWSDEETMWVSQVRENKLYAYDLATKKRANGKEFTLHANNNLPRGIWSDGTTMWVANSDMNKVKEDAVDRIYSYDLTTQGLISTNAFSLDAKNLRPSALWSDGTTMWIADPHADKLFAYTRSNGSRDASKDISVKDIEGRNTYIEGIWSDGTTLWAAERYYTDKEQFPSKIFAFKLNTLVYNKKTKKSTIERDESKDFDTLKGAGNHYPRGIWSDGATMWVVDSSKDRKIYGYRLSNAAGLGALELTGHVPSKEYENFEEIQIRPSFDSGTTRYTASVPYATESLTVSPKTLRPTDGVFSISPADADATKDDHQVNLADGDNPITITVAAENAAVQEYTINVARISDGRTPIKDIDLISDVSHSSPRAIWRDGTTWRWAGGNKEFYVYGVQNPYSLIDDNANPQGLWSDNATEIRVTDSVSKKIFFYDLSMSPITNKIVNIPRSSEQNVERKHVPMGLWSEGTMIWVANQGVVGTGNNKRIYAYTITNDASGVKLELKPANNITLNGQNSNPRELWSNGTTMWVEDTQKIYAYNMRKVDDQGNTVWDGVRDQPKEIDIESVARGTRDRGIWSDGTTMWVAGGVKLYAFNLPQPGARGGSGPSEDATLSDLRLSGMTLSPAFSPDNLYYAAQVDHTVASTMVTATANDSMAAVDIFSGVRGTTRSTANRGSQVSLQEGDNFIAVDVAAENGSIQIYLIEVTKAEAPPVSGGPLPIFQSASVGNNPTADSASSSTVFEKGKSRLIFAEPLLDGGVRFIFLVPAAEELKIETTPDLLSGEWRPLLDDEFKATRESNVDGQDRLTIILPKAAGKQRFLRLMPQR